MNHFPEKPDNSDPPSSSTQLTFPPKAAAVSCPRERLQRGQQARLTQYIQRWLCTVTHPPGIRSERLWAPGRKPPPQVQQRSTQGTQRDNRTAALTLCTELRKAVGTLICPLCFKFQVISCPASRLQFSGCVLLRLSGTVRSGRSQC